MNVPVLYMVRCPIEDKQCFFIYLFTKTVGEVCREGHVADVKQLSYYMLLYFPAQLSTVLEYIIINTQQIRNSALSDLLRRRC